MIKKSLILFVLIAGYIFAQPEIPVLKKYATDLTGTINSYKLIQLDQQLKQFENQTSTQVVFLMIPSLDGIAVADFAFEVAEKNKIGTKENSNGVLFLVSLKDRKMRIEVGYGLEGALPDALASSILRNEVKPYFKRGKYFEGVVLGLSAILASTKGDYQAKGRNVRNQREQEDDDGVGFPFIYIIFVLIAIFTRGGRGLGSAILLGSILGGSGGSRGGGGGFGGFSGGGFSGGGGGFGGGGASGSW